MCFLTRIFVWIFPVLFPGSKWEKKNENPKFYAHGEVYSIQLCVITFVSELHQVGDFLRGTSVTPTNKTNRHDITEILLKTPLNTINLNLKSPAIADDMSRVSVYSIISSNIDIIYWTLVICRLNQPDYIS